MANTSDNRRRIRTDALEHVLRQVRDIGCPSNQGQAWLTEFSRAIRALSRVIENQIAQSEQRVSPRKGRTRWVAKEPRRGDKLGGSVSG